MYYWLTGIEKGQDLNDETNLTAVLNGIDFEKLKPQLIEELKSDSVWGLLKLPSSLSIDLLTHNIDNKVF